MFVLNYWHYFKIMSNRTATTFSSSKCCSALPEAWAPARRRPCGALVCIKNYVRTREERDWQGFFFPSRPQYGILELRIPRQNRFVRALSSRVGSNALPCLIRSGAGRERLPRFRETSENWPIFCMSNRTLELFFRF